MRLGFSICAPIRGWQTTCRQQRIRTFTTSACRSSRLRTPIDIPPPFPITKTCPEPSCSCPPTPAMPEGQPIDYEQPLNGTMAAYAQQMVICTGQKDWTSRIEDDGDNQNWGRLVRGLKKFLGRGGKYADVSSTYSTAASVLTLLRSHSITSS